MGESKYVSHVFNRNFHLLEVTELRARWAGGGDATIGEGGVVPVRGVGPWRTL